MGLLKSPARQLPWYFLMTSPWRNSCLPNKLFVLFQSPSGPSLSCPAAAAGSVPAQCLAWEEIARWPMRVVLCNWLAGNAVQEDLAFFLNCFFYYYLSLFIKANIWSQWKHVFWSLCIAKRAEQSTDQVVSSPGSEVHTQPHGQCPGISSLPSPSWALMDLLEGWLPMSLQTGLWGGSHSACGISKKTQ